MSVRLVIQRVRWCSCCEKMLPKTCTECVKHPDRKPRMVEIFGAPHILATNECGCVKIRCQRPGCLETMWRHPRADGTLGYRNHFCCPQCVRLVTAAAKRAARVAYVCSCGCGRGGMRSTSNLRAKYYYFGQLCHYKHRTTLRLEREEEARVAAVAAAAEDAQRALLQCLGTCRGAITEHLRSVCTKCGTERKAPTGCMEARELSKLVVAGRAR